MPASRSEGEEDKSVSKAWVIVLCSHLRNPWNLSWVKKAVRTGVWRKVKKKTDLESGEVESTIRGLGKAAT